MKISHGSTYKIIMIILLVDSIEIHSSVNGKYKFQCPICMKENLGSVKSYVKANMKKHILRHAGKKPFKCEFCAHASNQKSNLKLHMMVH